MGKHWLLRTAVSHDVKRGWAGVTDPLGVEAGSTARCLSPSIKKSDRCFVSAATQGK